jgi:hypothetical protein
MDERWMDGWMVNHVWMVNQVWMNDSSNMNECLINDERMMDGWMDERWVGGK